MDVKVPNKSIKLSTEDMRTLQPFLLEYNDRHLSEVQSALRRLGLPMTEEFNQCLTDSKRLLSLLHSDLPGGEDINEKSIALIKRAVIRIRQERALSSENRSQRTFNKEMKEAIDQELKPISEIMDSNWFREATPMKPFQLADFVSIQIAEDQFKLKGSLTQLKREYDEKFGILLAPTLFLSDLSYYRSICELRTVSVAVAYIDIDDFKTFNTMYGNTKVDRDILPKFMTALEAHLYFHGSAYRYGGDEYVALMPNTSCLQATQLFKEFQYVLKTVNYHEVKRGPTVSIGICEITQDCTLTGHEIEDKACKAMTVAKEKGKDRIASMIDPNYYEMNIKVE